MTEPPDATRCPVCGSTDVTVDPTVGTINAGTTTDEHTICYNSGCPTRAAPARPVDELLDDLFEGDVE